MMLTTMAASPAVVSAQWQNRCEIQPPPFPDTWHRALLVQQPSFRLALQSVPRRGKGQPCRRMQCEIAWVYDPYVSYGHM